ncbi:mucin-binding protein [Limosilactobacillus reuteri]|uniref:mucin-binding protein n=1 Tax=Limosilactobacillus reuteri TaxID=1598 RepID=UPI00080C5956|nr:MucBP domain-containing protein [Limosilactobacillus reuteri]ANU50908.1 signal peptide protein [Limosilactobacillus reuteri]OXE59619.1 signal peptide protein [Limosilactobacillus reuteri]QQR15153.1 MucBP domain-containing protein [Limosilactobacillus reuteri]
MLDTDEIKKNKVIGVELAPVETVDGQVKLGDKSASSVASLNRTPLLEKMLKAAPNFAAQQQKLNGQEPVIKNNPALGEYKLIDDLGGLMHGTYLQATNSESQDKDRSLVSRNSMSETASLINYRAATDFSGYGHLKNNTETTKSVEVVYTLPTFEGKQGTAQIVLDGARINEFDGLEYKDEKGNAIPGFDITYSYQGHEGEYSTIDTLKQRDDFSWEKVTAVMVFGSLLPNSSYRVEFPFKITNLENINTQEQFNLNEYAFYDLTVNKHTTSQLNFRLSTPIFAHDTYQNIPFMALNRTEDGDQVFPEDIQATMPTLGEVPYAISNFNNEVSFDVDGDKVMWQGGQYFFKLAAIQSAIQEKGFSVNVDMTGRKLMGASAFMVQPTYLDFESFDFIPYVVIHQLLITKPFTLKAEAKDDWNSFGGIEKACGLSATNEELPVSPEQTFIVDDSELVDATPGDYNVIIGYFLNGSEDNDMLITSPAKVRMVENKQTINVYYVDLINIPDKTKDDLQPSDGKILENQTQTFTGKGDEEYHNQLWGEENGFEIYEYEQGAKSGAYVGGQPTKDYYVYLIHKIEKITEDHQVTRTITFNMPDGSKQIIKQTGKIQRLGITDKTANEQTWSDWSKAILPAVTAPHVPGYTVKNVDAEPISLTSKDSNINVIYHPKQVKVKIKYVDEAGNEIDEQIISGLAGDLISHKPTVETDRLADEGYVIVDNELPQNARLMAEDGEQEKEYKIIISKQNSRVQQITVFYVDVPDDRLPIVKPSSGRIIDNRTQRLNVTEGQTYNNELWDFESAGYELFKADKGALKGKYFAGSPEQQYYVYLTHQTTPLKKEHHVTRTIQITMPDQTQQVVTQEAIATRFGVHDEVLGSDIWQEWNKGVIPEYIPAPIAGYDAPAIPAEQVDENASDRSEKIVYTPQTAKIQVKFIDQTGTELASKELIGKTGEEFDYDPTPQIKSFEDEGYVLDENTVPADHHFLAGTQTYVINLKKLVAVTPHGNSETKSTIEQIKSTDDEKTENKRGIFAAFKGYFK